VGLRELTRHIIPLKGELAKNLPFPDNFPDYFLSLIIDVSQAYIAFLDKKQFGEVLGIKIDKLALPRFHIPVNEVQFLIFLVAQVAPEIIITDQYQLIFKTQALSF
jgi:hypothetical protein